MLPRAAGDGESARLYAAAWLARTSLLWEPRTTERLAPAGEPARNASANAACLKDVHAFLARCLGRSQCC
eukprot:scaffold346_cov387-Prasinococcus_capsulatus_cf.AAC.15